VATFNSVANFQNALIRKGLVGAVLVADYATAAIADIASTGGVLTITTGYTSLGKLSSDGVSLTSSADVSEVRGWGDVTSPARVDVTGGSNTMTLTAIETKKAVWDAFHGADLTSVTANANGTVVLDKPAVPVLRDKRVLFLARDVNKANGLDVYYGVHFPKANISQNGDQSFAGGDSVISYPLTINALVDDVVGTAVRLFLGGPGVDTAMKTAMGF
jgi:hypothetical protein